VCGPQRGPKQWGQERKKYSAGNRIQILQFPSQQRSHYTDSYGYTTHVRAGKIILCSEAQGCAPNIKAFRLPTEITAWLPDVAVEGSHSWLAFESTKNCPPSTQLLGASADLPKAAISFIISACPRGTTRFHGTELSKIRYLSVFGKYCKKIEVKLKYDENNGYFT